MVKEIKPDQVYTTKEVKDFLKISDSTIKRWLKKGVIKAYKLGGQYRIWGSEILKVISPELEMGVYKAYKKFKDRVRKTIEKW